MRHTMVCNLFGHKWNYSFMGDMLWELDKDTGQLTVSLESKAFPARLCARCGMRSVGSPVLWLRWKDK